MRFISLSASGLALSCSLLASCGEDTVAKVESRWMYETPAAATPPSRGPERRIVVGITEAKPTGGGEIVTLDEAGPSPVEGPLTDAPLTLHAPVMIGSELFVVSTIGRVLKLDLAGNVLGDETLVGQPTLTTALAVASDNSLRIATNTGVLISLAPDLTQNFSVDVGGIPTSAVFVASNGNAYLALDDGRVLGYDAAGTMIFSATATGRASGPSANDAGDVTVGDETGVRGYSADGTERFMHARDARVVGTRHVGDQILAWGEDGRVEALDAAGTVRFSFSTGSNNPAPISTPVLPLSNGRFAVIDDSGGAHLLEADGTSSASYDAGGKPVGPMVQGEQGLVYVSIGSTLRALAFVGAGE